ncbi:MAG TPA: HAD family phosphatase, partial [Spirochaetota bacterium]|nr:HAD family phosphatase [Spirochaetota bacterium]HOT19653.1 HAD family phosphatase [Spirochaetota bacterium]
MNYRTKKIKGLYVDTVLFDMDGVIVDSMYAHARCWIQVFEEHGVHLDAIDILKREGMSGLESIAD